MEQINPKKVTYWLLGETAGRTSVAVWKYLWGLPVEEGGKVAQKVAEESIISMQESITKLAEAVAKVVSTYKLAQQQYDQKLKDLQEAEKQARLAHSKGNEDAARLAITKAIATEKILPQLSQRVQAAKITMEKAQVKLKKEKEQLEAHKLELKNLETLALVNQAMSEINNISTEWDLGSARSQFTEATNAIEQRAELEEAKVELAENPYGQLADEIDALSLEEEIAKRLKYLTSQHES